MRGNTAVLLIAAVGILCLAIGAFYLIPGPTKPLVSDAPTGQHIRHALVFFGLGIVVLVGSRFARASGR